MMKKIIVLALVLAVTFVGGFKAGSNSVNVMHEINITDIDAQLKDGKSPGNIAHSIEIQREALTAQGMNVDALISHVWAGLEKTPGEL